MKTSNRYRYELPPRGTVVVILLYLGLSAWMVHLARSHAEMRVAFIALSAIFGSLALVVLIRRLAFPCTLELTDDAILLPRGHPWPRITTIPYADIVSVKDCGDSLWIGTGKGSFMIGTRRFEGYRAVREIISVKTAIALDSWNGTGIRPNFDSDELPEPLVQWTEPEDWPRFRRRAEISKPVLYQLRTELWFYIRCYAFCCAFLVVPCLGFVLLTWPFLLGPFPVGAVSLLYFRAVSVFSFLITLLHWLYGIDPVRPETKVSFRDRGITVRLLNGQQWDWNYRQFCGWAVIERQFKGNILQILLLKRLAKGQACNEAFALPDDSLRDRVVQLLNDRQVPQAPDLKPSWETK